MATKTMETSAVKPMATRAMEPAVAKTIATKTIGTTAAKTTKQEIYFITGNQSKFNEAKSILQGSCVILMQKDIALAEPQSLDQEQVVIEKARQAFEKLQKPVIVDDTGIYFEEYENFPGTYTKLLFKTLGFKGIERLLNSGSRNAYFRTLICYKDAGMTKVFEGIWKGKIIQEVSKNFIPDWQYDSIFVPDGSGRPLAEMPMEERAAKSHRKQAFDKLMLEFGGTQNE